MPGDRWTERSLGELIVLEYGAGLPQALRTGEGYPVYGSSGLLGRHSDYLIQGPGIIVGRKGTVGAVVWSDEAFWPIDTTYYVEPKGDTDLRWVYWRLSRLSLNKLDSSTGVPGLNRHDAYALKVSVPTLLEQRGIAEVLDTADDGVRQTERLIAKLKAIKAGLLHDLLTRGLDEHGQLRDPEAHPEQFKDSPLGKLPAGWKVRTIRDLAARQKNAIVDGPFGSNLKVSDYVDAGVPVLQGSNITGDRFELEDGRFVSPAKARELSRSFVRVGDLLVVKIGSVGYSAIIDDLGPYGQALIPANLLKATFEGSEVLTKYVHHYLTSEVGRRRLIDTASQTAQPALTLGRFKSLTIPVPPLPEQQGIAAILDAHDTRIRAEEAELAKLRQVKRGLMDDLLTGRVRVPNA